MGRLFHRLQDVDYEILYVPGSVNFLPNFLSRSFETVDIENHNIEVKSSINWLQEQSKDSEIQQIILLIENNLQDSEWLKVPNGRCWLRNRSELYISSKIFKHSNDKIVCPQHMKEQILQHYHDSPFSGHRAFETTSHSLKGRYFWNFMPSEVKFYCQSCIACQKFNYACLHNRAPLKPIQFYRPWQLVGVDFMGPFKPSGHGNKYIILGVL